MIIVSPYFNIKVQPYVISSGVVIAINSKISSKQGSLIKPQVVSCDLWSETTQQNSTWNSKNSNRGRHNRPSRTSSIHDLTVHDCGSKQLGKFMSRRKTRILLCFLLRWMCFAKPYSAQYSCWHVVLVGLPPWEYFAAKNDLKRNIFHISEFPSPLE